MKYLYYKEDGTLFINSKQKLDNGLNELVVDDTTKVGVEVESEIGTIIKEYTYDEMVASIGGLYVAQRQAEYPPITDYLDAVVKNDDTALQEYIDKCLAVKAKYPKTTEEV